MRELERLENRSLTLAALNASAGAAALGGRELLTPMPRPGETSGAAGLLLEHAAIDHSTENSSVTFASSGSGEIRAGAHDRRPAPRVDHVPLARPPESASNLAELEVGKKIDHRSPAHDREGAEGDEGTRAPLSFLPARTFMTSTATIRNNTAIQKSTSPVS